MSNAIAIIPARGGSKRIPRKNIKDFLGQPIMKYSIEAAKQAGCFEEVMVSTDDPEIADVARSLGANVPFLRSTENSSDFATTAEALLEVLDKYKEQGRNFSYCCGLYPTAPFITGEKLKAAYDKLVATNAYSVVPVVRFGFPIFRSFKIEDDRIKMFWPEYIHARSQDLPVAYHDCGQFYFLKVSSFVQQRKLWDDFTVPFETLESEVQDIDNEEDWKIAELKYKLSGKG